VSLVAAPSGSLSRSIFFMFIHERAKRANGGVRGRAPVRARRAAKRLGRANFWQLRDIFAICRKSTKTHFTHITLCIRSGLSTHRRWGATPVTSLGTTMWILTRRVIRAWNRISILCVILTNFIVVVNNVDVINNSLRGSNLFQCDVN